MQGRFQADYDLTNTCKASQQSKRKYTTIEEAWRAAFLCFVDTGIITTPYACKRRYWYITGRHFVDRRWHMANPWRFASSHYPLRRHHKKQKVCGFYHLTRIQRSILNP